ncbi:MAG: hypothetical protein EBY21_11485, partial [Alphaproteobacteria bacterium]|nr:hypothetical protein [Alphaproteobacteria bacterium]
MPLALSKLRHITQVAPVRGSMLGLVLASLSVAISLPAAAQGVTDCASDVQQLQVKRQSPIDKLNALNKEGKGKLDPVAACPLFRSLVTSETQLLDYMVKNQTWCDVPEDAITNVRASRDKTKTIAAQACKVAAEAMKAQKEGQAGMGGTVAMKS